jgi:hypothetical protein
MEFKWSIDKVNTVGENNLVQTVFLTCTASKGNVAETYSMMQVLQSSESFIDFDKLTEQQVLDWCFTPQVSELKNEDGKVIETFTKRLKEETEAFLTANVERQLAQQIVSPALPWVV